MVVAEIFTAAEGTILFGLVLVGMVLCLVGIVDVTRRPAEVWAASGHSRTVWLVLNIVGLVFGLFFFGGLMVGLIYMFAIRPKLALAGAPREP